MEQGKDVVPVDTLIGRSVLSLSSGNVLGTIRDVFIDPLNGVLVGFTLASADGLTTQLTYDQVHSFGRDAIMVSSDDSVTPTENGFTEMFPHVRELVGTKIISDSGNGLGHISNLYVTVSAPPIVIYEIQESLLDKLLGRRLYILTSMAHALSDDRQRLIVPDETSESAATSIEKLLEPGMRIRSISAASPRVSNERDDTVIVLPFDDGDETVVRIDDEDETVVRGVDEDETVLRFRRRTGT